jgi:hypothetical protein
MRQVCPTTGHAWPVRLWLAGVLVVIGLSGCDLTDPTQCRQQWADLHQSMKASGNPGTARTPTLTIGWKKSYDWIGELAKAGGPATCRAGAVQKKKAHVQRIESVLHAVGEYDIAGILVQAYTDLEHAEKLRGPLNHDLVLREAFLTLRVSGHRAEDTLASAIADVDAVDPDDKEAVQYALASLRQAAEADPDYRDFEAALRTIETYHLDQG